MFWHSRQCPRKTGPPHSLSVLPRRSLLDLHLPGFAISGAYNLEEILPRIGLGNIFNLGADLLGTPGRLNGTIFRV